MCVCMCVFVQCCVLFNRWLIKDSYCRGLAQLLPPQLYTWMSRLFITWPVVGHMCGWVYAITDTVLWMSSLKPELWNCVSVGVCVCETWVSLNNIWIMVTGCDIQTHTHTHTLCSCLWVCASTNMAKEWDDRYEEHLSLSLSLSRLEQLLPQRLQLSAPILWSTLEWLNVKRTHTCTHLAIFISYMTKCFHSIPMYSQGSSWGVWPARDHCSLSHETETGVSVCHNGYH